MKKLYFLFLLSFLSYIHGNAQPVTFSWASAVGGKAAYNGRVKIVRDNVGNIYATGDFTGTQSFGSISLTASGYNDVFVAKFDPTGACIWAIKAGAAFASVFAGGIELDNNYNIYFVGNFTYQMTIGTQTISSVGGKDIFLARLDNNGNLVSLIDAGGTSDEDATCIHYESGCMYVAGYFAGTCTFGSWSLVNLSTTLSDIFLAKFDPNGTSWTWAVKAGGNLDDKAFALTSDASGKIIVTGSFQATATFGTNSVVSTAFDDLFIAKYDQGAGNSWVVKGGGAGNDMGNGISTDMNNNIYVAGYISSPATFGSFSVPDNGYGNAVIAKYDAGGICLWAKGAGGGQQDVGFDISTEPGGSSYVTGMFQGSASFSGTPVSSNGLSDAFVAKYNTTGGVTWVTKIGGTSYDYGKSIIAIGAGHVIVAGDITGTVSFGATSINAGSGTWPIFITELNGGTVGMEENNFQDAGIQLAPNPVQDMLTITSADKAEKINEVKILNNLGQEVWSRQYETADFPENLEINVSGFANGMYHVMVRSTSQQHVQKLVVQRD